MSHFEFTGAERPIGAGKTVRQIRTLVDLPDTRTDLTHPEGVRNVKAGEVGGWIESKSVVDEFGNLRPRLGGTSWVADEACVYGQARLEDDARIEDNASIYSNAVMSGQTRVRDHARISGHARILGRATVDNHSMTFDDAVVEDDSHITDSAVVCQNSHVAESARIGGNSRIRGSSTVTGGCSVLGLATIEGNAVLKAETIICGTFAIGGEALIESSNHMLVIHPIGPATMFATLFYRTASGLGEVAHRFEQPWLGSLSDFRVEATNFLARLGVADPRRSLWRAQYDALDALATLAERNWQSSVASDRLKTSS
ncbi:hypothetical protein [Subtercola sp. YIM 133946]|uniref:hypothetical protein n=1 Tax=Subtercola sp. YIM 133946 TaxID=3118909 RepID=UPI002F94AA9A